MLTMCYSGAGLEPQPPGSFGEPLPRAARSLQPPNPNSGSSWQEIKGHSAQLSVPSSPTALSPGPPVLPAVVPHQLPNRPTYHCAPGWGQGCETSHLRDRALKATSFQRMVLLWKTDFMIVPHGARVVG